MLERITVLLATTKSKKQNKPIALLHKSVMKNKSDNYYWTNLKKAALARLRVVNRSLRVAKWCEEEEQTSCEKLGKLHHLRKEQKVWEIKLLWYCLILRICWLS